MKQMSYDEAVKYIENAAVRGSQLGLHRVRCLCELLGDVHKKIKCIHIAGTNGKGSTACMLESILREAGYKTGFYYSPAMTSIKDHYMVNGILISDDEYKECVQRVKEANERLYTIIGEEATQFELETALAFYYFAKKECDVVILETGLGGELDATNIVTNKVLCILTSISYDHMAILGDTLFEIASVKSGIITNSCPVVAYDSGSEVVKVIEDKCQEYGNKLYLVDDEYSSQIDIKIRLEGKYQSHNRAIAHKAACVLKSMDFIISEDSIKNGLEKAYWPFRFEKICDSPLVYVDGAHNYDAANRLIDSILEEPFKSKELILVLGMFKDKEYDRFISTVAPLAKKIFCITTNNPERALPAIEIKEVASKYVANINIPVVACSSIDECATAVINECNDYLDKRYVLACGSLSYLNDFKKSVLNQVNN